MSSSQEFLGRTATKKLKSTVIEYCCSCQIVYFVLSQRVDMSNYAILL